MNKSESLKNLAVALVKAQKSMGVALKDSKNPFFKSRYADLNAIIDAAIPSLNDQGIAVLQSPDVVATADGGSISVINTILLHESGEFISGSSKVVAAKQNDPQAEGSATTYARRYGLQAMVTLKAEDDDGEAAMGRNFKTESKKEATITTKAVGTTSENIILNGKEASITVKPLETVSTAAPAKKGGWSSRAKAAAATPTTETKGDLY